jgi:hypothetical protein
MYEHLTIHETFFGPFYRGHIECYFFLKNLYVNIEYTNLYVIFYDFFIF